MRAITRRSVFATVAGFLIWAAPAFAQFTITTVAGTGQPEGLGDGGPAISAYLIPYGEFLDSAGNLYIADGSNLIRKVSPSGIITTVAGGGPGGSLGDGAPAISATLSAPSGVVLDSAGNMYIADFGNARVRKVSTNGIITTYAGGGNQIVTSGQSISATTAFLNGPTSLVLDANGNLYFGDSNQVGLGVVYKVTASGVISIVAGGPYNIGYPTNGDGGPATAAALSTPTGVAFDSAGNLYIADAVANRVRKVSTSGIITTFAGSNSGSFSGDGGPATAAGLSSPDGIAVDSAGNVYISDTADERVRMVTSNGNISTIAGNGVAGFSGDGGPATSAMLYYPTGLAMGKNGVVYVADTQNVRVRALTPAAPPAGTPPSVTSVVNASSFGASIAPNTWVSIVGANLAPSGDTRIWRSSDFVAGQMPTSLDGVSVTMNGEPAYVYYISPTQVNVLSPPDLATGAVQIQATNAGVAGASFTVQAQAVSPSFFVFNSAGYVAATHLNGGDIGPASLYPGLTTPAQAGEEVVIYGNGFGPVSPAVSKGSESQSGTLPVMPVIKIGGLSASVQFGGLISPGLFQFNVVVPSSAANGDNALTATYDGESTQSGVLLTVASNNPPSVQSVTLSASSASGAGSVTGTVTLSTPAPNGGAVVTLSSSSTAATVPATVTIPAGSNSATFTITLAAVNSAQTVTITASYSGTSEQSTISLTAGPPPPPFSSLLAVLTFQPVGYAASQLSLSVLPNAGNTTYTATAGPLIVWPSGTASNNNQTFTFNTIGTGTYVLDAGVELIPVTSATLTFTITPSQGSSLTGNLSGTLSATGTAYPSGGTVTVSGTIIGTYSAVQ